LHRRRRRLGRLGFDSHVCAVLPALLEQVSPTFVYALSIELILMIKLVF
jgi:hypothetical protein